MRRQFLNPLDVQKRSLGYPKIIHFFSKLKKGYEFSRDVYISYKGVIFLRLVLLE